MELSRQREGKKKLDTFQTKRLKIMFRIRWQKHYVQNKKVLEITRAYPICEEVRRRRWSWTGDVLRKEVNNDCAVALAWKPEGKRNRGRPKTTWRRTVEKERQTIKDGTHRQEQDRQQTIAINGRRMSRPCAPPGSKRFNNLTIAVYPLGGSTCHKTAISLQ